MLNYQTVNGRKMLVVGAAYKHEGDGPVCVEHVTYLRYKNFAGREIPNSRYPTEGKASFQIVFPTDYAEELMNDGWKIKMITDEKGDEYGVMTVNANAGKFPPMIIEKIRTATGGLRKNAWNYVNMSMLDGLDIFNVEVRVNPYLSNGGFSAYLNRIEFEIAHDPMDDKFDDDDMPDFGLDDTDSAPWQE